MLGTIVVRFMSVILNTAGFILIIAGAFWGAELAKASNIDAFVGFLVGLIASFLFVVVTFGTAFLILEINNNLIRIRKALNDSDPKDKDSDPKDKDSHPEDKEALERQHRLAGVERTCSGCGTKYKPMDFNPNSPEWECATCLKRLPKE